MSDDHLLPLRAVLLDLLSWMDELVPDDVLSRCVDDDEANTAAAASHAASLPLLTPGGPRGGHYMTGLATANTLHWGDIVSGGEAGSTSAPACIAPGSGIASAVGGGITLSRSASRARRGSWVMDPGFIERSRTSKRPMALSGQVDVPLS